VTDELLVKGAQASLRPSNPSVTITVASHALSLATSGPFASASAELLVQADIEASFATYVTAYTTATHTIPGALAFQSLKSVSQLSTLTAKKGAKVATRATTGVITCSLTAPAQQPNSPSPIADATPSYDLEFSISNAGQTFAKSD
jgi:hypothetical protein